MQLSLQLTPRAFLTVFPRVEDWLDETVDHQSALLYVSSKKKATMDKYRSKIDYLFCEIFLEFQKPCFEFYDGEGSQLRGSIEEEARARYELAMLEALQWAYVAFCHQRRLSWVQFRLRALAVAA